MQWFNTSVYNMLLLHSFYASVFCATGSSVASCSPAEFLYLIVIFCLFFKHFKRFLLIILSAQCALCICSLLNASRGFTHQCKSFSVLALLLFTPGSKALTPVFPSCYAGPSSWVFFMYDGAFLKYSSTVQGK